MRKSSLRFIVFSSISLPFSPERLADAKEQGIIWVDERSNMEDDGRWQGRQLGMLSCDGLPTETCGPIDATTIHIGRAALEYFKQLLMYHRYMKFTDMRLLAFLSSRESKLMAWVSTLRPSLSTRTRGRRGRAQRYYRRLCAVCEYI
jgi:hypothetical protein